MRVIIPNPEVGAADQTGERRLALTTTGELYQPARVYFQVHDHRVLMRSLNRLRCISADPPNHRMCWTYTDEAKKLKLPYQRPKIPAGESLILGSLRIRDSLDLMVLDVRSFDRAVQAVTFFGRQIPRRLAEPTRITIVNSLFDGGSGSLPKPEDLFADTDLENYVDSEMGLDDMMESVNKVKGELARLEALMSALETRSRRPLPIIETLPVRFHEDGIGPLKNALESRQVVAMKHWDGESEFSMHDLVQIIADKM